MKSGFSWMRFVSMLSGISLVAFGGLSLLISRVFWSLPGVLVGAVLLGHGVVELLHRKRLFRDLKERALWWMIWNQIALGVSVSVYFLWQIGTLDATAIAAALEGPELQAVWELYPQGQREMILATLPQFIRGGYVLLAAVLWLGCLLTARLYYKCGTAYLTSVRELG